MNLIDEASRLGSVAVGKVSSSPGDTRAEMSRLSARGYTKLRHILVQLPQGEPSRVSTVGRLLTTRKHRALVLYLLLLMCWPWLKDRREPLEAAVWVRALTTSKGLTWSPSTLSRAWADLEAAGLIKREREGRNVRIVPRREDGQSDYEIPAGARDRWNTYFVLPDDFWTGEAFATLSFPGLAMLLIIAKETSNKTDFSMPYDRAKEWYGLSSKSVQNGIKDLVNHGLIHIREEHIPAPLSPTGVTVRLHYSLTGSYGQKARAALQSRAKKAQDKRTREVPGAKTRTKASKTRSVAAAARKTQASSPRVPRTAGTTKRPGPVPTATAASPRKIARAARSVHRSSNRGR